MDLSSPFGSGSNRSGIQLDPETKVVFVSDMFVDQYVGGAELTTESLIERCPVEYQKLLSKDVTMELLEQGHNKHWIFGNFSAMNLQLVPTIVANLT